MMDDGATTEPAKVASTTTLAVIGVKYVMVFVFVCFSLMSLDLFLALLFDFAQECKRLSVGGFDVPLFSPIS